MALYYDTITGKVYDTALSGTIPSITDETDDFVLIDDEEYFKLLNQTYQDSTKILSFNEISGLTLSDAPSFVPTDEYLIRQFKISIYNLFVANTATSYGYDSEENFISYYNSGITAWRDEAIAFNTWRDNTVSLMYDNIFSFTADGTTLPDVATGEFTGQAGYFDVGVTASRPNLFS